MTDRTFRPYEPEEPWLLPPSLGEWLSEDHLAYFVSDVVTELDLTPILKTYGGVTRGNAPYDPRMLVTILLDAYAVGMPASRQIARAREEDVAFRVLAANQRPDFRTISDFQGEKGSGVIDCDSTAESRPEVVKGRTMRYTVARRPIAGLLVESAS